MIRLQVKLDRGFKKDLIDLKIISRSMAATMKDASKVFLAALRAATPVWDGSLGRKGGTLQGSWRKKQRGPANYGFVNPTPYGYIVDQGRFRGSGKTKRTVLGPKRGSKGRGVFSSQAPRGITYPYGESQGTDAEWIRDIVTERFTKFYRQLAKVT